ncbi:hypothetical protein LXL04_007835 [Taraxacum kok-saghyz]
MRGRKSRTDCHDFSSLIRGLCNDVDMMFDCSLKFTCDYSCQDHDKKKVELEGMQIDIDNQREKFEEMSREFREQQALEGR